MAITYRLDVAFTSVPLADPPVWTNLSSYVLLSQGIGVKRGGRPDEFAGTQAGTLSVVLDNASGAFTPNNPSSPFYPYVRKNRRIRLTAIVAGVEYPRWDGHIDDWLLTYDEGATTASLVTVTATSRMKMVARRGSLRSFAIEEAQLDVPYVLLPLGDSSAATTLMNVAPNPAGNGTLKNIGGGGTYTLGQGTGPPADGGTALQLAPATSTSGYYVEVPAPTTLQGAPYGLTLACWVNSTAASAVVLDVMQGPKSSLFSISLDAAKKAVASADFGGLTCVSPSVVGNGASRHVAATLVASGSTHTLTLYVDGVQVASSSVANASVSFGCDRVRIGSDGQNFLLTGTVSHAAFFQTALTLTRLNAHYNAGWNGFGGERSDQRIARLAAYVGLTSTVAAARIGVGVFDTALFDTTAVFASADVSLLEQGSAIVYGQNTGGPDAITAMNDVAATEFGLVLMTRDGLLTFHSRSHRYNRPPSFALSATVLEGELTWAWDDSHQTSQFTATTQDGIAQTARNTASVFTETGVPLADEATLLTRDPLDAYSNASWRVQQYGYAVPRASTIGVNLATLDDSVATAVFASDVGDAFVVTDLSSAWAPTGYTTFFAEDYAESIGVGSHVVTWTTTNAAVSVVGVFDSASLGVFDSAVFAF
jgi:Concanavalin A-like lectin/glucanases superfamily